MSEPKIHPASFDAGVDAVLKTARAAALRLSMADRPPQTRRDFAVNALLGLAEEGEALKIGGGDASPGGAPPTPGLSPQGGEEARAGAGSP